MSTPMTASKSVGLRSIVPMATVVLILLMILPLPAFILDLLISLNIAFSLVTLLTSVTIPNPLRFSVLPSVLLLSTVARLGLNLASTRRILLNGADGTDAAGSVIEAFGHFVVGGNMVVGAVVFLVLLAVQFIVINHGANRISEVSARFTLDALPGKQMAIDADLNSGFIDEKQARQRRGEIQDEADFYGAMDGAVKFTQRDAIASLLIVSINIIAGLAIGILQNGMSPIEALQTYTVLTVGDGLVSAIPALLISVAGALMTTRSGSEEELSTELTGQLMDNPLPLGVAAGSLLTLGLIPGLPTIAFGSLAAVLGGTAYTLSRQSKQAPPPEEETSVAPVEEPIEPLLAIDPLTIEVGYDLVTLAGNDAAGGLLDRIRKIRRQVATELGIVVPPVRVRDNLNLRSDEYRVLLRGTQIDGSRLRRGKCLAIDPGDAFEKIEGEATTDPTFGIPALWIDEALGDKARGAGYTVVDLVSVMATHLGEIVRRRAPELLTRQEVQRLLDLLSESAPKLVEEVVPQGFTVGQVQKVLQALLAERISIRDMEAIFEALADAVGREVDLESLVAYVRQSIARQIVQPLVDQRGLNVITLSPEFDREVRTMFQPNPADGTGAVPADPQRVQGLVSRLASAVKQAVDRPNQVVLCGDARTRLFLRRISERALPNVPFLAVQEIPDGVSVNAIGKVS